MNPDDQARTVTSSSDIYSACEKQDVSKALHPEVTFAVSCSDRRSLSRHQAGPDWDLHREASEWRGHRRSGS